MSTHQLFTLSNSVHRVLDEFKWFHDFFFTWWTIKDLKGTIVDRALPSLHLWTFGPLHLCNFATLHSLPLVSVVKDCRCNFKWTFLYAFRVNNYFTLLANKKKNLKIFCQKEKGSSFGTRLSGDNLQSNNLLESENLTKNEK